MYIRHAQERNSGAKLSQSYMNFHQVLAIYFIPRAFGLFFFLQLPIVLGRHTVASALRSRQPRTIRPFPANGADQRLRNVLLFGLLFAPLIRSIYPFHSKVAFSGNRRQLLLRRDRIQQWESQVRLPFLYTYFPSVHYYEVFELSCGERR